jgi:hypothetical protein
MTDGVKKKSIIDIIQKRRQSKGHTHTALTINTMADHAVIPVELFAVKAGPGRHQPETGRQAHKKLHKAHHRLVFPDFQLAKLYSHFSHAVEQERTQGIITFCTILTLETST